MSQTGEDHKTNFHNFLKNENDILIQQMSLGYCLNEVIHNNKGEPVDFKILKINNAFRVHTGITQKKIEGKTILELYPNLDKEVISKLGRLNENGDLVEFETYSKNTDHYYSIKAYAVTKGVFVCLLKNVSSSRLDEEEIREKQIAAQNILNKIPNLVYIFDIDLKQSIYLSQGAGSVLGYPSDEINEIGGNMFSKLLHPEDKEIHNAHLLKLCNTKDSDVHEIEFRLKHKNGEYRTIKSYETILLRDNHENVKQLVGTAFDITDDQAKTNELSNTKSLLEAIFMQSPVPMALAGKKNNTTKYINDACCEVLGIEPGIIQSNLRIDQINLDWEEFNSEGKKINPDELPLFRALNGITIKDDERIIKKTDGSIRHINLNGFPIYNDSKELIAGAVIALDVTKQKQAEERIRESEKRFRTMIELNSIPMAITDQNQDIVMLNRKFTEVYGYAKEDVPTAEKWWETAYPNLDYRRKVQRTWNTAAEKAIRENSTIPKQTWSMVCKDGSKKTVEFSFVNLGDLNIISMNDITSLKLKEEELKQAKEKAEESDLLKSAFLANMSHEIRTPMNGLVGFVELLMQDNLSDEKKKFYRNVIQNSCQRLLNIINDILDISKIETNQYPIYQEEINLNDFMLETYSLFLNQAKKKDISINLTKVLDDKKSYIITDSQKLKQILNNLLSNAIKFTHEGEIELGYDVKKDFLEFNIKDTGIGISNEYIDNIFERFIQADLAHERKYGGTGLGLSIAKGFTELLGGTIACKSVPNEGSTFTFTLPYKPSKKNFKFDNVEQIKMNEEKLIHILVAEDEEINFLFIEEILKGIDNIKVIHVLNGEQAVQYVKEDPKLSLVLMDIKMPVMNGIEATKIIKQIRPGLPIIAQTAYAMTEDEQLAREAGCDSYVSKPIDREKFIHIIRSFI